MIIGIFGDSFADPIGKVGWPNLLKSKYFYNVKNYAKVCTTAFWSYCNLVSEINDIDVIIFVLTDQNRLYHADDRYHGVCTLYTIQEQLNNVALLPSDRMVFEAAKQYHIHLSDDKFNNFVHDQLVKEITALAKQHNKPLIIIPAFQHTTQYQNIFEISLFDITLNEIFTNFGDRNYRPEDGHTRPNHLSKENNEILALKINELINGKIEKIKLDDFFFEKYNNPADYWQV
jgi:hypothetical protein